tara:strand:- start:46 stop:507 length:462 start_codon:yes stop_codon:yes gene_type:complete
MSIPKALFLDYLATVLPYGVQPDSILDEPKSYPIKFTINYKFFSGKYIYLGEAAHTFHPVAGQGLNLCWRDVSSLTKIISMPSIKKHKYLIPFLYSILRILDVLSISILTDILVRYSRSNISVFYFPRLIIFKILKKSSFIRSFILNIMTNGC